VGGHLFDPVRAVLVDARTAVGHLLAELEEDLRNHDEWAEIGELVTRLFARGTSASRQRRAWHRTGDARAVAGWIVGEGRAWAT
jgi:carboxylate-amine ligase